MLSVALILALFAGGEEVWVFTLPECPPCKALKADLKAHPEMVGGRPLKTLDLSENAKLGAKMEIRGVPTIILMRDGKEVGRMVGYAGRWRLQDWLCDKDT